MDELSPTAGWRLRHKLNILSELYNTYRDLPDEEMHENMASLVLNGCPVIQATYQNACILAQKAVALRLALEAGVNPNVDEGRQYGKDSPLHTAVEHDRIDMVLLLLRHGADVNYRNHDGWTPIMRAYRSFELTLLLLRYGGKVPKEQDVCAHDSVQRGYWINHAETMLVLCRAQVLPVDLLRLLYEGYLTGYVYESCFRFVGIVPRY